MRMLAVCTVALSLAAQAGEASAQFTDEDRRTLESYRLTEAGIEQCRAANRNIAAVAARDPQAAQRLYALLRRPGKSSFAGTLPRLDAEPEMVEALTAARLAPRDYVLTVIAAIPASIALRKRDRVAATQLPEGLSRGNLDFARNHPELITELVDETKAMLERIRDAAVPTQR